jgi:hypothetical protein
MKIWIDDLRSPKDFRPGEEWHHCQSNTEAIRVLDTMANYITAIAIDHDICHQIPVEDFSEYFDADRRLHGLKHEYVCCETFEPTVRYLALWATWHNKDSIPIEIITSNTTKVDLYKEILQSTGERFDITVTFGGKI